MNEYVELSAQTGFDQQRMAEIKTTLSKKSRYDLNLLVQYLNERNTNAIRLILKSPANDNLLIHYMKQQISLLMTLLIRQ